MELKIKREVEVEETINIDFPYYYKQDLLLDESDVVVYGMLEENKRVSITVKKTSNMFSFPCLEFELDIEDVPASKMSCYMTDEYKGTEKEFFKAKELMLKAISEI